MRETGGSAMSYLVPAVIVHAVRDLIKHVVRGTVPLWVVLAALPVCFAMTWVGVKVLFACMEKRRSFPVGSTVEPGAMRRMAKGTAMWIAGLGLLLAGALSVRVVTQFSKRVVNRPVLAAVHEAREVAETPQTLPPRDPNFLLPQRLDAWRVIGPGGGGTFYNPAVSPHDPNLVFVSTDMTSCFVSENGGHTWRAFNLRTTCRFAFDPKLPNRVYAMAIGLWRSDDRGHTWTMIYPDSESKVGYVDDEGEPWIRATAYFTTGVAAMQVDPDDSNTLYACLEKQLQMSRDGGKSWKILASVEWARQIWVDPTSPRGKRTIYTRQDNLVGVWDGVKFVRHPVEGVKQIYAAAFGTRSSDGKQVLYVAGDYTEKDGQLGGGVMASEDGGTTWRSLNESLLKLTIPNKRPVFTTMAVSARHAEVLYLGFNHLVPPSDVKQSYYGVLKTPDGGATWSAVRLEAHDTAPNMHNDWTSERFGADWAESPLSMAADENNPDLVYTGDLGRVMRSTDGGKNWYGVFSQSTGKGYATTGLNVTTCYGLHIDPFDPKHMFISNTDIGLVSSEDGGESWVSATTKGVPFGYRSNTYWMEFDPAVKGKMWAVMSNHHDLPRRRMFNLYGGGSGGVVLSVDGGHSWTVTTRGLPTAMAPTHILLDPKSPVDARVLYVTAFGRGIYKSTDGGQSWVAKNNGLPEKAPFTWRMARAGDGTLYVVTIRKSQDGKYGNENDGFLFRSRDGAESWERVPMPERVNGPMGITVDPNDPARLYLSAWARYTLYMMGPEPDGGVYLSTDAGQHWQNVLYESRRIYDVAVDPRNSDLVYATGYEASAWRSTDRGKTWSRIGGFNFKQGHHVIPDPTDINKIYITTFGSSVWYGPAAGDPSAVEDIVGPPKMKFQTWRPQPDK
jgi:photosystem II stability/assembly factor-like uncharacterized protein